MGKSNKKGKKKRGSLNLATDGRLKEKKEEGSRAAASSSYYSLQP